MSSRSVLISGAGIAGPTLAFWLKKAGFEPTVVEHAPVLRKGGYVIDFWGVGYDIAERMGLSGEINRLGYHMSEMPIVDSQGQRITGFGTRVFREFDRRTLCDAWPGGPFPTFIRKDQRHDGSHFRR